MLREGMENRDLGAEYFNRLYKIKSAGRFIRRLQTMGFEVEVKPAA